MKNIDQLREEIEMIDSKILDLISERLKLARKIGIQKKNNNVKIFDKNQEDAVKKRWSVKAESLGLENKQIQKILDQILEISKETQRRIKKHRGEI